MIDSFFLSVGSQPEPNQPWTVAGPGSAGPLARHISQHALLSRWPPERPRPRGDGRLDARPKKRVGNVKVLLWTEVSCVASVHTIERKPKSHVCLFVCLFVLLELLYSQKRVDYRLRGRRLSGAPPSQRETPEQPKNKKGGGATNMNGPGAGVCRSAGPVVLLHLPGEPGGGGAAGSRVCA